MKRRRFPSVAVLQTGLVLFLCAAGQSQTQGRTIHLPDSLSGVLNPQCVLFDSATDKLFVSGALGRVLLVFDAEGLRKLQRLPVLPPFGDIPSPKGDTSDKTVLGK